MSPEIKFSDNNMWVKLKRDRAIIGVTEDFLQGVSEIVHLSLPKVGEDIIQDDIFGSIETANETVLDLVAPLSGEVVRVNNLVMEDPSIIIDDPYGDGWILEIEYSDEEEIENLRDEE